MVIYQANKMIMSWFFIFKMLENHVKKLIENSIRMISIWDEQVFQQKFKNDLMGKYCN